MNNELGRLLRAYIFALLIIICSFSVWAGVQQAKNNTRHTSFGEVINTVDIHNFFKEK